MIMKQFQSFLKRLIKGDDTLDFSYLIVEIY